jgi:hypothetical protein
VFGAAAFAAARQAEGPDVTISGELRQWHKVTLTLAGPQADEASASPNPFVDYRMTVTFTHESGAPTYRVPGYFGVPPDPGYAGFKGVDAQGEPVGYTIDDIRKLSLWGTLMAGGAGVEYYFGYRLADNDLVAENFRSRQQSWAYGRLALEFFRAHAIQYWEMRNADELVNNPKHENTRFCLAKPNELYLVYLPASGTTTLDLSGARGEFAVEWFNPRTGGPLRRGSVATVKAGASAALGAAPEQPGEDWLIVVRRR